MIMFSKVNTKTSPVASSIVGSVASFMMKRPWYMIRIFLSEPVVLGVALCEYAEQQSRQSDCVTLCQYYPRLRDFMRHVRIYGFPRLYCPVLTRIAQGVRALFPHKVK